MNLLYAALAFLMAFVLMLAGASRVGSWLIERRNPPTGSFVDVDGARLHYVDVPAGPGADLPTIVFIHGASGNLRDQMLPLRPMLEGRARLLFVDRPGHGWSSRKNARDHSPDAQADSIAGVMRQLGIGSALVVGHSFGGSVAAAFALRHPQHTAGLVFIAAATHPWPGGETSWYYSLTARPVLGRIFAETVAWPAGQWRMTGATACVFAPNRVPERYFEDAGIGLVLRPAAFRANAMDVAGLYEHVARIAPRYREITAPTIVISGDRDTVVYEEIHSGGLARDIPGAELVWVANLGHKPEWIAPDLVVAAVEKLAGLDRDLQAAAGAVEARIAADAFGPPEACPDEKPRPAPG